MVAQFSFRRRVRSNWMPFACAGTVGVDYLSVPQAWKTQADFFTRKIGGSQGAAGVLHLALRGPCRWFFAHLTQKRKVLTGPTVETFFVDHGSMDSPRSSDDHPSRDEHGSETGFE